MFRILDLDNCLADDAWRIPRINWHIRNDQWRRYSDYHSLAPWDPLGNEHLAHDLPPGCGMIILTGRPTHYLAATNEWLRRNEIRPAFVLTRPDDDHSDSVVLKAMHLRWLESHYGVRLQEIECAFDDRADVVAMYRAKGLKAEVARLHSLSAYQEPAREPSTDVTG